MPTVPEAVEEEVSAPCLSPREAPCYVPRRAREWVFRGAAPDHRRAALGHRRSGRFGGGAVAAAQRSHRSGHQGIRGCV